MKTHTLSAASHHFATGVMAQLLAAALLKARQENQITGHDSQYYLTIEQLDQIAQDLFVVARGSDVSFSPPAIPTDDSAPIIVP